MADITGLSTSGGHLAGFNNSVGSQSGTPGVVATRMLLRATGDGGFNVGLGKTSATNWVWSPAVFTTNDTVFVVGSYTFNTASGLDDVAQLWINPEPADFGSTNPVSVPLVSANDPDITANQIASFVFFLRTGGVQPAVTMADELRMGRTFADVTPTNVPNENCSYPVCSGQRGIVSCLAFTNKNYDIYLPPTYSATNNPLPILYTFNPNGNGMVGNFGAVASDLQIIVVGIRESSNEVDWYDFIDAVYAIVRDIRRRVNFDPTAEFTAGWSGGGYESYVHSEILRQEIAGVYPMCGWVERYDPTDRYLPSLLVARANALADNTGINDYWAPDGAYFDQIGIVHYDTWFPGPHAIAPDTNKTDCLTWLINHRVPPAPDAQSQAQAQAAAWRAAIANGQAQQVFAECFASIMTKPSTFEENQAQLVLDDLQSNYESFRAFNITNLTPGDLAADYLYYRAYGAGKIGDTNTYYSCLKAAGWLNQTSGDRTNDFKDLILQFGLPRPELTLRWTNGAPLVTFRKDAPWVDYALEQSTDLTSGAWTPLALPELDNGDGTFSLQPSNRTGSTVRYFRLSASLQ